jgi:formamidopyrimidine-DNA glycosylase
VVGKGTLVTLLPEAEVLRKELEREVVGQRIKEVTVRFTGDAPENFLNLESLTGQRIEAVIRQGTNLALRFPDGMALVIRSGSVATFSRQLPEVPEPPVGHVETILAFEGGGVLSFLDAERNGALRLVSANELEDSPEFAPIGIDPFTNTSTWLEFSKQLVIRNCRLRALLNDDTFVVGLGDVYSDEILWAAGLSGMRSSARLSAQEVRRLFRAIQEVLHEAVKQVRGASDPTEEDPFEDPLARQHLKVYGRDGQPCARCRQKIVFQQLDNPPVASYFCPNCQT